MEKRVLVSFFLLAMTTWTFGCAPGSGTAPTGEETCSGSSCSDTNLNAPVANQPAPTPVADDGKNGNVVKGNYSNIDPNNMIDDHALALTLAYYDAHYDSIKNKRWVVVINMKKHQDSKRFFLIDMVSGAVTAYHVAHGRYSDQNGDGYPETFSNTPNSGMSSLGFYLTAETYMGEHGYSMRLDGLSSTNSNVRSRDIVVHPADYVTESGNHAGRSLGCPALDPSVATGVIDKIKYGALMFMYYNQ